MEMKEERGKNGKWKVEKGWRFRVPSFGFQGRGGKKKEERDKSRKWKEGIES
ncbi:MAG: hypothetical protein ACM3QS_09765 [Bacteroidota bacterium]